MMAKRSIEFETEDNLYWLFQDEDDQHDLSAEIYTGMKIINLLLLSTRIRTSTHPRLLCSGMCTEIQI